MLKPRQLHLVISAEITHSKVSQVISNFVFLLVSPIYPRSPLITLLLLTCMCVRVCACVRACVQVWFEGNTVVLDHEPAYTPLPPGGGGEGFYHMVTSGYLDHQSTQFRLSASELLLFVVLVLINAHIDFQIVMTLSLSNSLIMTKKAISIYYVIVWTV